MTVAGEGQELHQQADHFACAAQVEEHKRRFSLVDLDPQAPAGRRQYSRCMNVGTVFTDTLMCSWRELTMKSAHLLIACAVWVSRSRLNVRRGPKLPNSLLRRAQRVAVCCRRKRRAGSLFV